jgi:hypothetical protein
MHANLAALPGSTISYKTPPQNRIRSSRSNPCQYIQKATLWGMKPYLDRAMQSEIDRVQMFLAIAVTAHL